MTFSTGYSVTPVGDDIAVEPVTLNQWFVKTLLNLGTKQVIIFMNKSLQSLYWFIQNTDSETKHIYCTMHNSALVLSGFDLVGRALDFRLDLDSWQRLENTFDRVYGSQDESYREFDFSIHLTTLVSGSFKLQLTNRGKFFGADPPTHIGDHISHDLTLLYNLYCI